jgi:hypothetical protein
MQGDELIFDFFEQHVLQSEPAPPDR